MKSFFLCLVFSFVLVKGSSQMATQETKSGYVYHHPSEDKLSWQRLNLWLSAIFYRTSKQSTFGWDSSLIFVSHSLGLSRLPLVTEGMEDVSLATDSKWFDNRSPGEGVELLSQASGKRHLQLLVLLGSYYAFHPDVVQRYKDSVEHFLRAAINESAVLGEQTLSRQALCLLGKVYVQSADTTNGAAVFSQLIDKCHAAGDKKTEAKAFAYRALYTAPSPVNLEERLNYIERAIAICQQLHNNESEIPLVTYKGFMYIRLGRFDDAHNEFLKALEKVHSIGFPYSHYNTDAIAMISLFQEKFGEPLNYALQTIKTAEQVRDSIGWALFYSRIGELYITEGGRDGEGIKWLTKSIERAAAAKDPALYLTLYTMVSFMNDKGRAKEGLDLVTNMFRNVPPDTRYLVYYNMTLATAYIGVKQYKLAEQAAMAADSNLKQYPVPPVLNDYLVSNIKFLFGSIYFDNKDFSKSRVFFNEYLNNPGHHGTLKTDMEAYTALIHIDSFFHDDASAVRHYRTLMQLVDSNFAVSKIRQAEELDVMYQTKEKEARISSLNEQATLERANLKQATLVKNLTIAGIIAVLIIAGLLYRQSRQRKKNNNIITYKNEQLQHLLTDKEWLLKEIHHRVKNNLQVVMSLLNSQSAYIDNDAALTAIHDSQHRVHAMSLIHQKLYNSENVSSIDMSVYIRELISYLSDSFDTGSRISFEFNIEPLEMDVSQAVPLGLILNEAITNALKYAFPNGTNGTISISLSNTVSHQYLLRISDDGVGMPSTIKKTGSLGMSLMKGLSEDLDGDFSIENTNGTSVNISFIYEPGIKRSNIVSESFVSHN